MGYFMDVYDDLTYFTVVLDKNTGNENKFMRLM